MSSEPIACRFRVSGRVQGVGFRAATRREAQRLAIDGHAINQADGGVEVLAQGAAEAVEQLADWLQRGPPFAQVTRVERESVPCAVRTGFGIG